MENMEEISQIVANEGCEFCEGNKVMLTEYCEYKVSLDGRIKIKGGLDGTDYLDINYCPMCGKRL